MKHPVNQAVATAIAVSALSIFFVLAAIFFANFDPAEMRTFGIFPWDSSEYRKIAEAIHKNGFKELEGMYPFAPRVLFPALYGALADLFNISYVQSAYFLNVGSAFFVTVFTFFFLKKNGISARVAFLTAQTYTLFWLGPLRYANVYPGGGFAFESAIVCGLFLTLQKMSKKSFLSLTIGTATIFLLTIGRELTFYLMCVSAAAAALLHVKYRTRATPGWQSSLSHQNRSQYWHLAFLDQYSATPLVGCSLQTTLAVTLCSIPY